MIPKMMNSFLASTGIYDATKDRGKRRAPKTRMKPESIVLNDKDREKLNATTHDIQRNFVLAAFACRRHLDYISSFSFSSSNKNVEAFMKNWGKRRNFTARRKFSMKQTIRQWEGIRTLQGDCFVYRLRNGRIQTIEGDNVGTDGVTDLTPEVKQQIKDGVWQQGVKIDPKTKREISYLVHDFDAKGKRIYRAIVPSGQMQTLGYYPEREQVIRGISPLASAITGFKDLYEGFDYTLLKIKAAAMFGLVTFQNPGNEDDPIGNKSYVGTAEAGDTEDGSKYEIDLGASPIYSINMEKGEDAKILTDQTPATSTQAYWEMMILLTIKCLDLPMVFVKENFTNFFGSRAAITQYQKSAHAKRDSIREELDELTEWRLEMAVDRNELLLSDYRKSVNTWKPNGIPWYDTLKEATGKSKAISFGSDNPYSSASDNGGDYEENIDATAKARDYAKSKGLPLFIDGVDLTGQFESSSQSITINDREEDSDA